MTAGGSTGPIPVAPVPDPRDSYRRSFILRVHTWLALGHAQIDPGEFTDAEETDITGELVRSMNDLAQRQGAPRWLGSLIAQEDVPISRPGARGKRRPRIDIQLVALAHGPRHTFGIEAKRLHRSDSVSEYLGSDGLGCFLAGRYAADQPDAGILGYVQRDEPESWAGKLAARLDAGDSQQRVLFRLEEDGTWSPHRLAEELEHTYRTRHRRDGELGPITIHHTLLRFQGRRSAEPAPRPPHPGAKIG